MDALEKYLENSTVNAPFFIAVGDDNYSSTKMTLLDKGLKAIYLSDFCGDIDKRPNLDSLVGIVNFADIESRSQDTKLLLLGLGEYLALCGKDMARKWLSQFKDMKVGNARVVLLLRGVSEIIQELQSSDPTRFNDRRVLFTKNTETNISITFIPANLLLVAEEGIKALIRKLENGCVNICVKTIMFFQGSLLSVTRIASAFDYIKHYYPVFDLDEACGDDNLWSVFLTDLTKANGDFDAVFHEFGSNPEKNLFQWINGISYRNWLYFVALKYKRIEIENSYLGYVLDSTISFTDFKRNLLDAIISVQHTDPRFDKFYKERKELIEKLTESDVAAFVAQNKIDPLESVYKLTNQTLVERKEFIALFSRIDKRSVSQRIKSTYIALSDYLQKYSFNDPKVEDDLNALFTSYFDQYKWQKVLNTIDDEFLSQIEELAKKRVYTRLRSRNEVINAIDKSDTFLYWIDSLGLEYLGFFQQQCERKGVSLRIHIAQADLPTITTHNKDFYADWVGKKEKDERLDSLKHKESGGYDYQHEKLPIHLAEEIEVLGSILEKAATKLALHLCKKVLIVSDHGASRLAVIKEQEVKYDTDTRGEHSGRCCKIPPDYAPTKYDLPHATECNGYLVLADYGRFKGSRAANVEVHGGASLEEVVVPIIELTLSSPDTAIEIVEKLIIANPLKAKAKPAAFTLFSKSDLSKVSVIINDKRYLPETTDKSHHRFVTEITKAGVYLVDVYDGDNLIGNLTINVQSETGKKNDAFEDMF